MRRAGNRARTDDLLITNQLLYQLSYAGVATVGARGVLLRPRNGVYYARIESRGKKICRDPSPIALSQGLGIVCTSARKLILIGGDPGFSGLRSPSNPSTTRTQADLLC